MISNQLEKDFFKTLNALKKKNPEIYDPNVNFFGDYETGKIKQAKLMWNLKNFIWVNVSWKNCVVLLLFFR